MFDAVSRVARLEAGHCFRGHDSREAGQFGIFTPYITLYKVACIRSRSSFIRPAWIQGQSIALDTMQAALDRETCILPVVEVVGGQFYFILLLALDFRRTQQALCNQSAAPRPVQPRDVTSKYGHRQSVSYFDLAVTFALERDGEDHAYRRWCPSQTVVKH